MFSYIIINGQPSLLKSDRIVSNLVSKLDTFKSAELGLS